MPRGIPEASHLTPQNKGSQGRDREECLHPAGSSQSSGQEIASIVLLFFQLHKPKGDEQSPRTDLRLACATFSQERCLKPLLGAELVPSCWKRPTVLSGMAHAAF